MYEITKTKEFKQLVFYLLKEFFIYCVKQDIIQEFLNQGLDKVYKKEIEEWLIYLDQKKFSKKLEKQMKEEIDRYLEGKQTIDELLDKVFVKPEFKIEYLYE